MSGREKRRIKAVIITSVIVCAVVFLVLTGCQSTRTARTDSWDKISEKTLQKVIEEGTAGHGYWEIGGNPYYFDRLGKPSGRGWIEDGGNRFYCSGEGRLATGWHYIGEKAYYFYEDAEDGQVIGAQARDYTTSGKITIPESGYLEGDDALAIGYALDVLNRYGWNLKAAYKYSGSLKFEKNPEEVYGFKIRNCAIQGFKYGKGNCLSWAGTFCVMAKVMGYDCRLVWGTLPYKGEQVPHGWAEIWEDDGIHVYDPRRNGWVNYSGFDGKYGDKGTLRYNEDSRKYLDW